MSNLSARVVALPGYDSNPSAAEADKVQRYLTYHSEKYLSFTLLGLVGVDLATTHKTLASDRWAGWIADLSLTYSADQLRAAELWDYPADTWANIGNLGGL